MPDLRVIRDDTPALSDATLQELGNELVTQARIAAMDAVRLSMIPDFLERGKSLTVADIKWWREEAKEAREAWRKVENVTSKLIREVEKNREAARAGKKLAVVPDGSGRPGHYKTSWIDDPGPHTRGELT